MAERRFCINCGVLLKGMEATARICRVCQEHDYERDDEASDQEPREPEESE